MRNSPRAWMSELAPRVSDMNIYRRIMDTVRAVRSFRVSDPLAWWNDPANTDAIDYVNTERAKDCLVTKIQDDQDRYLDDLAAEIRGEIDVVER